MCGGGEDPKYFLSIFVARTRNFILHVHFIHVSNISSAVQPALCDQNILLKKIEIFYADLRCSSLISNNFNIYILKVINNGARIHRFKGFGRR